MLVLLFTTTFIAAAPRMSEEAFLAKWSDVLSVVTTDELMGGADRQRMAAFSSSAPSAVAPSAGALGHHRQLQGPPPTPGSNPFAMLIAAIQQITGAWQSIVNAFKSSYSEEISDKEFANGWSKFKESTKVFKGAGLEYAKTDEFFTDIQSMISIPADYKDDFNQQVQWIKFFDNLTWSEHNTQFNQGKGGSDTMFTMYARNREADQKIDVLFLTIGQEFKLADNYFVISESKSILGGIFSAALVESATFASFHLDIKNDKGHFDAHVGTLRNCQGSFYVGYTAGSADGDLVRPLERHQKAIDAVGGADPGTVICQFFDMKKRGYTDKEIILIQNGLQAYAYKKAASMVPQAAKKSLPAAAAEQAASDEATSCDARSLISRHEGKRQCVYKDTRGIPTIGIGYNLENPGARSAIAAVGADYESILSGKTCLTDSQVMQLFEPSYQSAVSGAQV